MSVELEPFYNFLANVASYALLVVPAALFVRHYQSKPESLQGNDPFSTFARAMVHGKAVAEPKSGQVVETAESRTESLPLWQRGLLLSFFVVGLQVSYIVWGILQEQMMTQSYGRDEHGEEVYFKNSQYLVFLNRALAFVTALILVSSTQQPRHTAPLYKYSFPSMSNILSSWCQYEALKYVSFPTQVLSKATKTIPVMIMGKFVEGKTYPTYEYMCALIMSLGTAMFLFSRAESSSDDERATTITGGAMLLGYMIFDSFTSNYQAATFKKHGMSEYQMMLGVNFFSSIFCLWTLVQRQELGECLDFTVKYPKFFWHSILLSITSATGQIFIFHTISRYGALVFTIIMTTRQAFSVFLSALLFHHNLGLLAWLGIVVVFISLFLRIYMQTNAKKTNGGGRKGNGS